MSPHAFNPDYAIAPGATLQEWREENNLPLPAAAKACGIDPKVFRLIERGKQKITGYMARRASVWSDLLTAAFQEVDWYEIAENYLEEIKQDV